ncbi:MAG: hypothetical protein RLZZ607_1350 [Pseudomonadota bacterium]|jgi:hypothetical protein
MTPPPAVEKVLNWLSWLITLCMKVVEAGFVLVLLSVLLYILLGADAGLYVGSIVINVKMLIYALTPQAVVGIAIVLTLGWIAKRPR